MSNIYPVPITRIVVKVLRKIPKPEYRSHIHKWPRGLYLTECTMYRLSKSFIMGSNSYWSRIYIFLFFSQSIDWITSQLLISIKYSGSRSSWNLPGKSLWGEHNLPSNWNRVNESTKPHTDTENQYNPSENNWLQLWASILLFLILVSSWKFDNKCCDMDLHSQLMQTLQNTFTII